MATITVGTFNLNNLFSRFNFTANVADAKVVQTKETTRYTFDAGAVTERTYLGKLVKPKSADERAMLAGRIRQMNVDVLAVQEVEDIDVLKHFVREDLGGLYPFVCLIEGNDPRLIDVGVISKLPFGAVSSWQHAVHADRPSEPVFGRDLLEIEVLDPTRRRRLFTLFNSHLKSHFIDFTVEDKVAAAAANDRKRRQQAEVIAEIVRSRTRQQAPFVVVGDMNDPPRATELRAIATLDVVNALAHAKQVGQLKREDANGGPGRAIWTHRFKEARKAAEYALFDHIWLSRSLAERQTGAWIGRRERLSGDASDHDPAWVRVEVR